MGLLDDVRRLFADAEVSLVGGREERGEAERALDAGDWFRARAAARRLLERAPRSPIGLGLLANACEGAGLDAELEQALASLAKMAGASPDVWLRLGRVRRRVGAPAREVRDALVRAVAWDDDPDPELRWAARSARVALADLELAESSPARAEGWLAPIDDEHADVVRRRLIGAIARRARDDVTRLVERFAPEVIDGDGQRVLGEAQALLGDLPAAARALARAAILGDDRAVDALREVVARTPGLDAPTLRAVETVASALGLDPSNGPLSVEGELVPIPEVTNALATYSAKGLAERPEVLVLEAERRSLELRADAFRRARISNPTLSLFAENDGFNERVLGLGVSFPIPLPGNVGHTYLGEIAEADALARRAATDRERIEREIRSEIATAAQAFLSRAREIEAFTAERVTRAETTLVSLGQEVEAGRLAVRDAVVAQQALIELLRANVEARRAWCLASVALAHAIGVPLEGRTP
ncbi:MAG: hypothetical protein NVS3B10_28870 [Polyangiales bacterium]